MYKIKTYNQISSRGLDRFSPAGYQVGANVEQADAIMLRSQKLQGIDIATSVKAVARAGAGVNNVPVAEYSKQGIVVFNTPGANANAVKELVLAGLILGSRGILQGISYVQTLTDINDATEMSKLLENEKSRFAGVELAGKTLGIVGLGAIGSLVADMALALGMQVVGFDPALSVDAAWRLPSKVARMENLPSLLARSDYVTLHVPAIDATRHMINDSNLAAIKEGAILLNFARETIVDSEAVIRHLETGRLAKYVCDFPEPKMLGRNDVIALPHIGASTAESEENCAVMAANQLIDFLENGNIANSVNFPAVSMARAPGAHRVAFSNDNVAGVLGHVLSVLANKKVNVIDMINKSRGELAYNLIDVESILTPDVIAAIEQVEHVIGVRVIPGN